eukprot:TRINITY_DN12454_c0_g1_i1.p1 TRINITY_DN12454_c0_g1~~TRINITY_DN12454_c0_g1_i1.p1  ORF type:complete len:470 (+),score=135.38 TRINITY_DN12454_c0_g1_i1:108-1517(+)
MDAMDLEKEVQGTLYDSDEEFEFESDEGDEEGEEDDDANEMSPAARLQNEYYVSKSKLSESSHNPDAYEEALAGFNNVVEEAEKIGELDQLVLGCRASKQRVKLFYWLTNYERMIAALKDFLSYVVRNKLHKNEIEKCINSIIECVSTCEDVDMLLQFYQTLLVGIDDMGGNERLAFRVNIRLGELYFDQGRLSRVAKVIKTLRQMVDEDEARMGTQTLEINALEIRLHTATKDTKKLKELYEKSITVKSAVAHPRIMGIIRECGGKMFLVEENWERAQAEFFKAFEHYDETANPRRCQCLKYMVLASMLSESSINPFAESRAASYKNAPEVAAMTRLVEARERGNITEFGDILAENEASLLKDEFVRTYVEELLRSIRSQALVDILGRYDRVKLSFLARYLNVSEDEVENLLVMLLLDERIHGKIDQLEGILELHPAQSGMDSQYRAIAGLAKQCTQLAQTVADKMKP